MQSPYTLFDIHAQQPLIRESDPTAATKHTLPLLSILGTERSALPLLNALVEYGGCIPMGQEQTAREYAALPNGPDAPDAPLPHPEGVGDIDLRFEAWCADEDARKWQRDAMLHMRCLLMASRITRHEWPAPLCDLYNSLVLHSKLTATRYWDFVRRPTVPWDAKQFIFIFCCRALQNSNTQSDMRAPTPTGLVVAPMRLSKPKHIRHYIDMLDHIRAYVTHIRETHTVEVALRGKSNSISLADLLELAFVWGVPRPDDGMRNERLLRFLRELIALYLLQGEQVAPKRIRLIPYE